MMKDEFMMTRAQPAGTIAVIFTSQRTSEDDADYQTAAQQMSELAAAQPGYRGQHSVRGSDGFGITISYWADEASAKAWRDHPNHAATREAGRDRWYDHYSLEVAEVARSYDWIR